MSNRSLRALAAVLLTSFTLTACSTPGEDEGALVKWACLNTIGWLMGGPSDRIHYAGEATDMYIDAQQGEADGEDWDLALETSQDMVTWYDAGNEGAVRAFIDVNDCFNKGTET